jgi:hypothetical protein
MMVYIFYSLWSRFWVRESGDIFQEQESARWHTVCVSVLTQCHKSLHYTNTNSS